MLTIYCVCTDLCCNRFGLGVLLFIIIILISTFKRNDLPQFLNAFVNTYFADIEEDENWE